MRARAWLELLRISNAPTCVSNALVGIAIGLAARERHHVLDAPGVTRVDAASGSTASIGASVSELGLVGAATLACLAILFLYSAGMILNDCFDRDLDARERPSRPIPSGRIPLRHALLVATMLVLVALALLAWSSLAALAWGVALLVAIVAYDLFHRLSAASVAVMGLCRALTYPLAAATLGPPEFAWDLQAWLPFSLALAAYVIGLSLIARGEMRSGADGDSAPYRIAAALLPLVALAPVLVVHPPVLLWTLLAAVALFGWGQVATARLLARPPRIGAAVGAWIAGICLVDAVFLTLLGAPLLALIAGACWAVTALAQRRVAGT